MPSSIESTAGSIGSHAFLRQLSRSAYSRLSLGRHLVGRNLKPAFQILTTGILLEVRVSLNAGIEGSLMTMDMMIPIALSSQNLDFQPL